jgi:ppGpp synthetase/RelA/SpoT-type nucleotidyltranferase
MDVSKYDKWLNEALHKHKSLTDSVCTILENLLIANKIDYLAVTGRTKDLKSALEKIKRKSYSDPAKQMTDLSGIRVILYFESDVKKASKLIEDSFRVDKENSLNQDDLLSTNQIGYRSVHFVCDLGDARCSLPEFKGLESLKFEFQIRTILQHAWAELAHDRNYKFSGKLPKEIERNLFLYAGMLEIADKGFDEISTQIDAYMEGIKHKAETGDLDTDINSLSLKQFVETWSLQNKVDVEFFDDHLEDLVAELLQFGIKKVSELKDIIPENYVDIFKKEKFSSTIYGIVRDWMLIHDWRAFDNKVSINWVLNEDRIFAHFFDEKELAEFLVVFPPDEEEEYDGAIEFDTH